MTWFRNWLTLSWSGLRDDPSGLTSPIAASTCGRSRFTWALMPRNMLPVPDTLRPSACWKAIRQDSDTGSELPFGR